jgi:hypothetical protein
LGKGTLEFELLVEPTAEIKEALQEDNDDLQSGEESKYKRREHMVCRYGRELPGYKKWLDAIRVNGDTNMFSQYTYYFCNLFHVDGPDVDDLGDEDMYEEEFNDFRARLNTVSLARVKEVVKLLSTPKSLQKDFLKQKNSPKKLNVRRDVVMDVMFDAANMGYILKAPHMTLLKGIVNNVTLRLEGEDSHIKHIIETNYPMATETLVNENYASVVKSVKSKSPAQTIRHSLKTLENATIVFTGVRPSTEQETAITRQGARITSSVSGKTTLLVIKDSVSVSVSGKQTNSAAQVKAAAAGIKIMKFKDFVKKYL